MLNKTPNYHKFNIRHNKLFSVIPYRKTATFKNYEYVASNIINKYSKLFLSNSNAITFQIN